MLRKTNVAVAQLAPLIFSLSPWSSLKFISGTYQAEHWELVVGGWQGTVSSDQSVLKAMVAEMARLAYALCSQSGSSNFHTCTTCEHMQMLKQFSLLIWDIQIL